MLSEGKGWSCYANEEEFVKYFKRLKEIGMSFDEIESKLPQLEKYYQEMVVNEMNIFEIPTLKNLFIKWKKNN